MFDIDGFFSAVIEQKEDRLREFFKASAWVRWICTNEHFTVEEYIRANCEYPGKWCGVIEKCIWIKNECVVAAKVWSQDETISVHVVSFIRIEDNKIASMDEYWADDDTAPEWRKQMKIGHAIKERF